MCDRTLCPQENSSDISYYTKIFAPSQQRYESIDPFATTSQLNRTPESFNQTAILNNPDSESRQVQENLASKTNQITPDDSSNIEQTLNSQKSSRPYSVSRKSNTKILANNLPNNNLPIQPIEMMNLPTNQQVSLRDALEIVPYFDGSSKVPITIFIEACKAEKKWSQMQKEIW